MSQEELIEVKVKVPKNVLAALREVVLPHDNVTEEEYWKENIPGWVVASVASIYVNPSATLKKYDLMKYCDC